MDRLLTDQDLGAIRQIFEEGLEQLAQATAAGFEDVQQQIYSLQGDVENLKTDVVSLSHRLQYASDKIDNIEHVQQAEVQRSDRHDLVFRKMSHALKTI